MSSVSARATQHQPTQRLNKAVLEALHELCFSTCDTAVTNPTLEQGRTRGLA